MRLGALLNHCGHPRLQCMRSVASRSRLHAPAVLTACCRLAGACALLRHSVIHSQFTCFSHTHVCFHSGMSTWDPTRRRPHHDHLSSLICNFCCISLQRHVHLGDPAGLRPQQARCDGLRPRCAGAGWVIVVAAGWPVLGMVRLHDGSLRGTRGDVEEASKRQLGAASFG